MTPMIGRTRGARLLATGFVASLALCMTGCAPSALSEGCSTMDVRATPTSVTAGDSVEVGFGTACAFPYTSDVDLTLVPLTEPDNVVEPVVTSLSDEEFRVEVEVPADFPAGLASLRITGGVFTITCGPTESCVDFGTDLTVRAVDKF